MYNGYLDALVLAGFVTVLLVLALCLDAIRRGARKKARLEYRKWWLQ